MKHNKLVLGIAILSAIICVGAVFSMPETVPTHWNAVGEIDAYGSRYTYLMSAFFGLGVYFLMNLTKKIDPLENKIDEKVEGYQMIRDILTVIMCILSICTIIGVFVPSFNMTNSISVVLGLSFIFLGNYMPRVPHNYFLGAKTPWALADENNWKKTQRMSGYLFCLSGAVMLLGGIFSKSIGMMIGVGTMVVSVIFIYVYSWYISKH